jgi:type I restriction enzyme M protein
MDDLIAIGIKKGIIKFDEDQKFIKYVNQNKKRSFSNPEEKVQAETFLKLVIDKGYPPENIVQFYTVTMGADKREADIVVFDSPSHVKPIIVVECKREEVSEQEFQQAVNQAFSYAHAIAGSIKYLWVTSGLKDEYFKFDKESGTKEGLPDIPQFGSDKVAPYRYGTGGGSRTYIKNGKEERQNFKDIQIVSEQGLTKKLKQAHDALWAGGQLNPSEAFDELDKLIFCKVYDEKYKVIGQDKLQRRRKGEIYDFQVIQEEGIGKSPQEIEEDATRKTNKALEKRIKAIYNAGKKKDKEVFKDDIRLSPQRLRTVVEYLQGLNFEATDLDSKGRAFETFMGSFFRGEFGQYFTPRNIVQFIVESLPIKNTSIVLDSSCGSGGFLLYALDKVRKQADKLFPHHGAGEEDYDAWREHWHDFASTNLYGIEISEQIARTAKMNMIIHDDGHTNVISLDGLESPKNIKLLTENNGFQHNRFDFIITNPPFGSSIKKSEKRYLSSYVFGKKEYHWLDYKNQHKSPVVRNNQSTEILFIEQCYHFLSEGGYLAVVIPDGILTNSSLQYVRDQIEDWYRIIAVVSMPQTAFSANGAGVKSSVLFLRKQTVQQTRLLEDRKIKIQQRLLVEHNFIERVEAWEKEKKTKIKEHDGFVNNTAFMVKKEIEKTEEFKDWKQTVTDHYNTLISNLKEEMEDAYLEARRKELPDYQILMAIAENIGYDATGKDSSQILSKQELIEGNHQKIIEKRKHDLYAEEVIRTLDLQGNDVKTEKEVEPDGILEALKSFINAIENEA